MSNPADTMANREWIEKVARDFSLDYLAEHGPDAIAPEHKTIDAVHAAINERFSGGRGGVGYAMNRHRRNLFALVATMVDEVHDKSYREHERNYREPTYGPEWS